MSDTVREPSEARPARIITVSHLLIGWLLVVVLFFIWQTASYTGLVARVAEWQFARIGGYFPLASACLFVVLLSVPVLYMLAQRERRALTAAAQAKGFVRFLAVMAAAAGACGLALGGYAFSLSLDDGTPSRIDARGANLMVHDNGAATLSGLVRYDRIAEMSADLPALGWGVRFAPVTGNGEKGNKLRYFVETASGAAAPRVQEVTGTLRAGALRGDIINLFRDAGYEVTTPHYVLYRSNAAMRAPYLWGSGQFMLVALVLGAAAAVQRRRLQKISRTRRAGTPHAIG